DDDYESIKTLFKLRAPALIIGLILGIGISFITSNFEEVLAHNVQVAFFLPFIVYIADAIGTQTEAIYSRDLRTGKAKFSNYFRKELMLGLIFGFIFCVFSGGISFLWLGDKLLALSVSVASFLTITIAPLVVLLVAYTFQSAHKDPAAGTGPVATVIQDMLSVVIYGIVTSIIIL
ncbi:MAG: magnesium transporter, partial [Candidatus Pacebacteria bacterium]|nr:magnesium transporter [Candidatus Paceibacterota bacterium]